MKVMNFLPLATSAAAAIGLLCPSIASSQERTWTSTSGSTMRGEIVGVKDGKALIRPVTPAKPIPISSLSKRDQEFIENWQKEEAERLKTAKAIDLERHMNTPLLKAVKGNLQKMEDEKLVAYEIPNPGKLSLIAVYYTANKWEGKKVSNPAMKDLSKLYRRLVRRYPHFEMVLFPFDERETDLIEFMEEEEILFPTLKHAEVMKESGMALRATFGGSFPVLMLLDREGKVLVNSADKEDGKPVTWSSVIDKIEDVVKDNVPKDDNE